MRSGPRIALAVVAALAVREAAAADVDPVDRLRSSDAAARVEGLKELADEPLGALAARRATLHAILPKLLAHDPSPEVRGAAARVLLRCEGDDALSALVEAFTRERDAGAEARLAEACDELWSDAARKAIAQVACDAADPRRAALAAEALGRLRKHAGEDDLLALVDSASHWAVTAGACLGLGSMDDARAVAALLPRLRHPDPAVKAAARESLVRIAGDDFGTDPARWEEWWNLVKKDYHPPAKAPEGPSLHREQTSDRPAGDSDATFARFFGVELRGRRLAFDIDFSQSMWGPRREKAEAELVTAVKGLPSTSTFAVVLFNDKVWWFKDGPLPARPQEKLDLAGYLSEQVTRSYTNIYDALEQTLGLAGIGPEARVPPPGLDEMVILSDGVPNRGKVTQPAKILEAIRALNAGRVKIHAVALGEEPGVLLPALAEQNGGRYVVFSVPK